MRAASDRKLRLPFSERLFAQLFERGATAGQPRGNRQRPVSPLAVAPLLRILCRLTLNVLQRTTPTRDNSRESCAAERLFEPSPRIAIVRARSGPPRVGRTVRASVPVPI